MQTQLEKSSQVTSNIPGKRQPPSEAICPCSFCRKKGSEAGVLGTENSQPGVADTARRAGSPGQALQRWAQALEETSLLQANLYHRFVPGHPGPVCHILRRRDRKKRGQHPRI